MYTQPVYLSYPPSGLSLYVSDETRQALLTWAGGSFSLGIPTIREKEGVVTFAFSVNSELPLVPIRKNGENARVERSHRISYTNNRAAEFALAEAKVPFFSMVLGKFELVKEGGKLSAAVHLSRDKLVGLYSNMPRVGVEPPAVVRPPATAQLLLVMAGKEIIFQLPVDEAFALALEWTQKGYTQAK